MKQATDIQNFEAGMVCKKMIIRNKYWSATLSYKKMFIECLFISLAKIYNVHNCKVYFALDPILAKNTGGGTYSDNLVTLHTMSVMTAIHEFGHHLQANGYDLNIACSDIEIECQQWSHTIFFIMSPSQYFKSLKSGKFYHSDVRFLNPIGTIIGASLSEKAAISRFHVKFSDFICSVLNDDSIVLSSSDIPDLK